MKKTFYETLWSLLENQGILQKWFDEGLLVTRKNTTFWTPKALELLGLEESIGGVNLSDEEPKKKPREVTVSLNESIDWLEDFLVKFSVKNIGISGKSGNIKAVSKKMSIFLKENDYTKEEILLAVDLYIQTLKKSNNLQFIQEAHYFISKQHNGIVVSNLSKWCEEVRNSGGNKKYTSHTLI